MASASQRDNLVAAIARIQKWTKSKVNMAKSEVESNLNNLEKIRLDLEAVFSEIRTQYGQNELPFHENAEQQATQLYQETLGLLQQRLESFVQGSSKNNVVIDWANEVKSHDAIVIQFGIHKAGLARVITMCSTIREPTIHALNSLLDLLEEHWSGYIQNVSSIFNDGKMDEEITQTELGYLTSKTRLKSLISGLQAPAPPVAIGQQPAGDAISRPKLPPIQIAKFDGNYKNWTAFHDLFNKLVNINGNLSGAQKLYYLRSSLDGDAAQLVQSYEITDANYLQAWNSLIDRYQNKRLIVNSHLKSLFGQTTLQKESATDMRKQLDSFSESVNQLRTQGMPIEHWDGLLVYMFVQKLDPTTRRQWELSLVNDEIPTFIQLRAFVETRARSLAASATSPDQSSKPSYKPSVNFDKYRQYRGNNQHKSHHSVESDTLKCPSCKMEHFVYACPEFLKLSSRERFSFTVANKLCFNCLRGNHSSKGCQSGRCRTCDGKHHTLLHYAERTSNKLPEKTDEKVAISHFGTGGKNNIDKQILLSTALAMTPSGDGILQPVRILLDSGSQISFITESCVQRLRLARTKAKISISGLGAGHAAHTRGLVNLHLKSLVDANFGMDVNALVLDRITSRIPNTYVSRQGINFLESIVLADPHFDVPGDIDVLIGADAYGKLLLDEVINGDEIGPSAQKTNFGWVLFGPIISNASSLNLHTTISLHTHLALTESLQKFWELEHFGTTGNMTQDERACEEYFAKTHRRDETGRFVVKLPFNNNKTLLGDSLENALKSLQYLERRFVRSPDLKLEYTKFINEYLELGHMELAKNHGTTGHTFYLPHHPVFKQTGGINKIRVVFDASRKTSSGVSLNEKLLVGPKLQDDLVDILLRFRTHMVAFTCDIAKMYRQVLVDASQRDFQRIVWRESTQQQIQHYVLKTVTYGTAAASYLATKSLQQLAICEREKYPLASKVTQTDFYVDDIMTGCNTIEEALALQSELVNMLHSGGMELRKWSANHIKILQAVPVEHRESKLEIGFDLEEPVKTLGLYWFPGSDTFGYNVQVTSYDSLTKRKVLSEVAKLFDPLGFLAPVIITAKIFMQSLWAAGIDWDDALPDDLAKSWVNYRRDMHIVDKIKIERFLGNLPNAKYELHGFCDSSELAYGAVIYLRSVLPCGKIEIRLITAKTKVAPLKKISVPRLELCGALLLARLLAHIRNAIKLDVTSYTWTDSTVVLAWLRKPSHNWQTFVANRVSEIQSLAPSDTWHHVPGIENPADCASRGLSASNLLGFDLWWHGPSWLAKSHAHWPQSFDVPATHIDEKTQIQALLVVKSLDTSILASCSTLAKLSRKTARIWRFINNCRSHGNPTRGNLTVGELQRALWYWIKLVQSMEFRLEIKCCKNKSALPSSSVLKKLKPFLDENGLLRVGGRLAASDLEYGIKHPIIIPKIGHLSQLIISDSHLRNLHSGIQLTLCHLRQLYWIIGSRSVVKQHIHGCVTCVRHARNPGNQQMAGLLPKRVQPSRPFLTSGVDYAGPFTIRQYRGRCNKTSKAYVALFVCFSTKAIHLELVSDLTSNAFLAALRRFFARRGRCADIHSDCGTNFVGADREMRDLFKSLQSQLSDSLLANTLASEGTNWHFIPPGAPSFGGIWEAGVKQVKHHLRRILGSQTVTFEEMATILAQIEACLNSRPLCALSDDAEDYAALTPGHFLIGEALNSVPDPDVTHLAVNRLSRWQLMQQLVQHFWNRWRKEYLATLQQRNKWLVVKDNLRLGMLALIIDERLPPAMWSMGRIIELHPGPDGLMRVVTLKTNTGNTKKTVHKLVILPVDVD